MWDISTNAELRSFAGLSEPLVTCAFDPSGRFALAGTSYGQLRVWDTLVPRATLSGDANFEAALFEGAEDGLFTYSNKTYVRLRVRGRRTAVLDGREVWVDPVVQTEALGVAIRAIGFSSDNTLLVVAGRELWAFAPLDPVVLPGAGTTR